MFFDALGRFAVGQINPPVFPSPVVTDVGFGGYVKKRKDPLPDLIDEEVTRKDRIRGDIKLAIYGPEPEELPPAPQIKAPIMAAPNVEGLTRSIMQARTMEAAAHHRALLQDDEDVLDLIMRDLG